MVFVYPEKPVSQGIELKEKGLNTKQPAHGKRAKRMSLNSGEEDAAKNRARSMLRIAEGVMLKQVAPAPGLSELIGAPASIALPPPLSYKTTVQTATSVSNIPPEHSATSLTAVRNSEPARESPTEVSNLKILLFHVISVSEYFKSISLMS